jgi:hypothetical protein
MSLGLLLSTSGLALWSGSAVALSQQANQQYRATFQLSNVPKEGRVGLRFVLPTVEIKNTGTLGWPQGGSNQIKLGYRWFYGYGAPVPKTGKDAWDDLRAELPQDIGPGLTVIFPQFVVGVPNSPGDYVLHLNLIQGETFFSDKGSPDYEVKVTIQPRDSTAPTASMGFLPLYTTATTFPVSWTGTDETGGTGVASYDVQYRVAGEGDWRDWLTSTTLTNTQFTAENGKLYSFRVRATDLAGNSGNYPNNEQATTRVDTLPPASKINTLGTQSPSTFLVRWSSFDNVDLAGPELYDVEYREGNGQWVDWISASPSQAAVFRGEVGKSYAFRVRATDYAGNQEDYSAEAQATTTISLALDSLYAAPVSQTATGGQAASTTAPATTTAAATTASTGTTTASGTTAATGTTAAPSTTAPATTAAPTTAAATQAPAPAGPPTAIFPLAVKNGENGTGTTGIVIKNPGTNPINVFIRLNDRAGAPLTRTVNGKEEAVTADTAAALARIETVLQTIPAGESKTFWSGNISSTVLNGWASINSDAPFQATAVRLPGSGVAQPVEYAGATPSTKLYLPFIRKGDQSTSSIVNLANPGATPASFTISYFDSNGGRVVSETRQLGRLASTRISLNGIPTGDPNLRFVGSASISSTVPLAASVENTLDDGSVSTYAAVPQAGPTSPEVGVYKEVDGVTTSLIVQNTAQDQANVKVEFLDQNGQVVASTVRALPGNGRAVFWQGDLADTKSGFAGRARVSATNGSLAVISLGVGPNLKGRALP